MKRITAIAGVLLVMIVMTTAVSASGRSQVAYTWTVADLGQGVWGGGPLYADGTAGGQLAISAYDGQLIYRLEPTSWSEVDSGFGPAVDVCFTLHEIKGSSELPPSSFCSVGNGGPFPVTGTPIIISVPESTSAYTLFRVTPVN